MSSLWIMALIVVYGIIVFSHFAFIYDAAKRMGYAKDSGRLTFLGLACLFWPITWIVYILDRLRHGRV